MRGPHVIGRKRTIGRRYRSEIIPSAPLSPVRPRPLVNDAPVRVENAHSPRAIWPVGALGQGNRAGDVQCISAPLREDGARAIEKLDAEIHCAAEFIVLMHQHERQRPAHGSARGAISPYARGRSIAAQRGAGMAAGPRRRPYGLVVETAVVCAISAIAAIAALAVPVRVPV